MEKINIDFKKKTPNSSIIDHKQEFLFPHTLLSSLFLIVVPTYSALQSFSYCCSHILCSPVFFLLLFPHTLLSSLFLIVVPTYSALQSFSYCCSHILCSPVFFLLLFPHTLLSSLFLIQKAESKENPSISFHIHMAATRLAGIGAVSEANKHTKWSAKPTTTITSTSQTDMYAHCKKEEIKTIFILLAAVKKKKINTHYY